MKLHKIFFIAALLTLGFDKNVHKLYGKYYIIKHKLIQEGQKTLMPI